MKLVNNDGKVLGCVQLDSEALGVLSGERLEILKMLSKDAMYPAEIARSMSMPIQNMYYHIRLLEKAGFVKFLEYHEQHGGVAKRYKCTANGFAVVINNEGWKDSAIEQAKIPKLFGHFVDNGSFNGKIVVGSPDPHGRYKARGSELCTIELAMLLGRYAAFSFPLYLLDTECRQADMEQNLVLVGGPKVNTLIGEVNNSMPIKFDQKSFHAYSTLSKKSYSDNVGIVQLFNNPFNKQAKVLFAGGLKYHGTRAAVLAMVEHMEEIEKGNAHDSGMLAKVVQGFDENGDGIVDSVEFLE